MSYSTQSNVFVDTKDVVLYDAVLAAAGASNGSAVEVGKYTIGLFDLVATGITASDTLDAKIQTSKDGSTWRDVASFTQITSTSGSQRISAAGLDRWVRAVVTPTDAGGGGVAATVKISGELK